MAERVGLLVLRKNLEQVLTCWQILLCASCYFVVRLALTIYGAQKNRPSQLTGAVWGIVCFGNLAAANHDPSQAEATREQSERGGLGDDADGEA